MYIFDNDVLKEGDILLTAQKNIVSKAIRIASYSDFSHAMLYVGEYSYIHSDSDGVHSGNTQRLLLRDKSCGVVLRVKDSQPIKQAVSFARFQIGIRYSIKEAIRTKKYASTNKTKQTELQFCSRLVAQAYDHASLRLVDNSDYCTPQDIRCSPHVSVIENGLKKATDIEVLFAKSESLIDRQTTITNKLLSDIRDLTKTELSVSQLLQFIIENPKFDHKITEIIEHSGYLTMWEDELHENKWRYNGGLFMELPIDLEKKRIMASKEISSAENQLQLYRNNYKNLQEYCNVYKLRYLEVNIKLYATLTNYQEIRLLAAKFVLDQLRHY